MEKRRTKAGTDIEEVKRKNAKSGLSYNDLYAKMVAEQEVQTTDEIALEPLSKSAKEDSSATKLNRAIDSPHLSRNAPRW